MDDFIPADPISSTDVQTALYNRQAEEAVLGAVLITPEAYFSIAEFLNPDDFYIIRNRWVWESFIRLHETRTPIDFLTVCEELDHQGRLSEVGGDAYIMALINQTPTSMHSEAYAHIVEQFSIRRRMLNAANEMARLAYDQSQSVDTIIDEAEKSVFGVSERRTRKDLVPINQVLSNVYDHVSMLSSRSEDIFGVPTGLIDLDHLLGGLQKSDLLIVAGRPGMGKTGFLLSVAKNAAQKHKKHVAIFSLEMSNEQLVQRLIAQETGIDTQRLRSGKLQEDDWPLFTHAIDVLGDTHLYLDDTPAITPLQLRTKCRRLHLEYGLDLIIVDYLQLMSADSRNDNRVQEVSYISRNLKVLARELNVPVLTAAQLSRAVEQRTDKRPVLSDLRESGCLTGDTRITLASGEQALIADLVGKQPEVICMDDQGRMIVKPASKIWLTGHRPVYRMVLASGREIRATDNHPFRMLTDWRPLGDLQPGDRIAIPSTYSRWVDNETEWSDARLILLGQMIGDGCYVNRQPLHYTSASMTNIKVVRDAALVEFGIDGRIVQQENWFHLYLSASANKWNPNPMRVWLRQLGIDGHHSYEKYLPGIIFSLPTEKIALLLRHLWATDGSIGLKKTTNRQAGHIYYATTSKKLAEQIQLLLNFLGIQSRVSKVTKKGYRPGYHVSVSGRDSQLAFAQRVGAFGDRLSSLEKLVNFLEPRKSNPNRNTIPIEVWGLVKNRMHELGITQREMAAMRGTSYGGDAHFGFAPTRPILENYAELLQDAELHTIADAEIYWDEVISIVPDGEEDVFDMTVPEAHNFVANGILVHNSLEQDADIVMFIHRPDAMEKESPKQAIAEIIVAKHRNGPTHPGIELVFLNNLARFENAATMRR